MGVKMYDKYTLDITRLKMARASLNLFFVIREGVFKWSIFRIGVQVDLRAKIFLRALKCEGHVQVW